jgi:hypothetical protein
VVGEVFDHTAPALHYCDFQTIVGVEMDVSCRHRISVGVMLNLI